MTTTDTYAGPTLNRLYNQLLIKWAAGGHACSPECEDCGISLVGRCVVDCGCLGWLCEECSDCAMDDDCDDREDFHSDV